MIALLLALAAPQNAVDTERAFAAAAHLDGQWTAFKRYAATDAIVFTPQPVNAHAWLTPRVNPAWSERWWPTESWTSCDGKVAINTGGARWINGSVGRFTTVWRREANGTLSWVIYSRQSGFVGDVAKPDVRHAACSTPKVLPSEKTGFDKFGGGQSPDGTLSWRWSVAIKGARTLRAYFWNGRAMKKVVDYTAPGE